MTQLREVNCYNEIRDYVHVMDVASGHVTAMLAMFKSGFSGAKVYNLGIGKGDNNRYSNLLWLQFRVT